MRRARAETMLQRMLAIMQKEGRQLSRDRLTFGMIVGIPMMQMLLFGSQDNCEYCESTRQLLEELAATHEQLSLSVHDVEADAELAARYGSVRAPDPRAPRAGETGTRSGLRARGCAGTAWRCRGPSHWL